jgi:Maltogenic Amylase, C-terminal domain
LGWGTSTLLENDPASLFAHRCDWQGSTVITVHNLSASPIATELDLGQYVEGADDLLDMRERHVEGGRLRVDLAAYGYLWLRARRGTDEAT